MGAGWGGAGLQGLKLGDVALQHVEGVRLEAAHCGWRTHLLLCPQGFEFRILPVKRLEVEQCATVLRLIGSVVSNT